MPTRTSLEEFLRWRIRDLSERSEIRATEVAALSVQLWFRKTNKDDSLRKDGEFTMIARVVVGILGIRADLEPPDGPERAGGDELRLGKNGRIEWWRNEEKKNVVGEPSADEPRASRVSGKFIGEEKTFVSLSQDGTVEPWGARGELKLRYPGGPALFWAFTPGFDEVMAVSNIEPATLEAGIESLQVGWLEEPA